MEAQKQTFKVVLDGIELSEEQTRSIAEAVQATVLRELSDHDALFTKGEEDASEVSILSRLKGIICGGEIILPELRGEVRERLGQNFSG